MYPSSNNKKKTILTYSKRDFTQEDEEDFDDTMRFAIKPVSSLLLCCNKTKKKRYEDEDSLFDVWQPEEVQNVVYFNDKSSTSKRSAEKCCISEVKRPQRSGKQLLQHCPNTECVYNKRKSIIDYKPLVEHCNTTEDFMHFVPVGSMNSTPSTTKLFAKSAGIVPKYSLVSVTPSFFNTMETFDDEISNANNQNKKVDFIELIPIKNPSLFSEESEEFLHNHQLDNLPSLFKFSQKLTPKSSDDRFILETLQIWKTEILPKPTSYSAEDKTSKSDFIKNELSVLKNELKDARVLRKGLAPPRFYTDEENENLAPQNNIHSVIHLKDASDYPLLKNKPINDITENRKPVVYSKSIRRAVENLQNDPMYSILKRSSTVKYSNKSWEDILPLPDNKKRPLLSPIYKPSYAYTLKRIPSSSVVDNCIYMPKPSKANIITGKLEPDVRSDHPVFQLCEMIEVEETRSRQNLVLLEEMKKERDEHLENIFVTENSKR